MELFDSALTLIRSRRNQAAKTLLFKADKLEPENVIIVNGIGCVYHRENQYDSAIAYFKAALSIDTSYMGTYINYCNTLNAQGRYEEAIQSMSLGLKMASDTSKKYLLCMHLANSYSHLQRCDEAHELIQKALNNSWNKKDEIKDFLDEWSQDIYTRCPYLPFASKNE